ncbi:hypothetical protein G5714_008146 [Onychostoma macrolepis]|uniref:Uncharacterized protein n=1 Tax=Onychostoma macrolepis TaxID=369639 RepID=A0A7J6CX31_9TELE|nr:hypothetical protein G5714_008146 [Onychostoma macrolepis]
MFLMLISNVVGLFLIASMSSMVLQLLLHLQKLDGFTLQAGVFITPSDVQQSLHLPENTTYNSWSISKQPAVDVEQPNFVSGLAVLFVLLYDFNLQYQEEVACTPAIEVLLMTRVHSCLSDLPHLPAPSPYS